MYRMTENCEEDILPIIAIYNEITGRNRAFEEHQWEWFGSSYKNKSYVITDNKNQIIGHHGLLTVELDFKDHRYCMGKTENTIIKKGFGAVYPKNEVAMFKEYSSEYDVLMTTAAWGVTRRIREKLGYEYFASYVNFIGLIDSSFLATRFANSDIKAVIHFFSPMVNLFLLKKKRNAKYTSEIKRLNEIDLYSLSEFYEEVRGRFGYMQTRIPEFLKYRFLENPYAEFFVMYLYEEQKLIGAAIYTLSNDKIVVEDLLVADESLIQETFNRLYNYAKANKLAKVFLFSTLENSVLDKKYKYFFRKTAGAKNSVVMVKNNIQSEDRMSLKVENIYFTRLTNEGIS